MPPKLFKLKMVILRMKQNKMGLKFSDALRLSWSNIAQHKSRSIIIVLTISMLFGLIMGTSFILQGLRDTISGAALQANNGKIYLEIGYSDIASINVGNFTKVDNLATAYDAIRDNVANYDGQIVGEKTTYQIGATRYVINLELAERLSELDFGKVNNNQVPFLAPEVESDDFENRLKVNGVRDDDLVKVGTYPTSQAGSPTLSGFNPLNLLLGMTYGSANTAAPLLIDDDSEKIQKYLQTLAENDLENYGYSSIDDLFAAWPPEKGLVIELDNYEQALAYYRELQNCENLACLIQTSDGDKHTLLFMEAFGSTISTSLQFDNLQLMLNVLEVLFIIIAIIIATLTFAHLVDQDTNTIALYRAMGASSGEVYLIYFLYLLELCLLATLACIAMALMMVGMAWLFNADALSERLKEFYLLQELPKIKLIGFNPMCFWTIGSIIIIAPFSLLFALRHFSVRHIAKRMKED